MSWVDKYTGIDFVSNGRDKIGCDCYGLVRMIVKEENGLEMESFQSEYYDANHLEGAQDTLKRHLGIAKPIEVFEVKPTDIIVFKIRGMVCHLGVVVDPKKGTFIHTMRGTNSHIGNYKYSTYKNRVEGFYRYEG